MKYFKLILGTLCVMPLVSFAQQKTPATPSDFRIDGAAVTPPATPPPAGNGAPSPSAGNTIVFDTRAGGRQDFQAMTNISQMLNAYGGVRNSNGASQFFETNVDGAGTNARGCQWAVPNGSEQECYTATEGQNVQAPATGWYTQFKVRLGKGSGLGGVGAINAWGLTGANGHQKTFIWTRANSSHRMYMVIRPSDTKFSIDGLNWSSPNWSVSPDQRAGQVMTITTYISPANGIVRAWINSDKVLDASGQQIGNSGLIDIQESVTTFPSQQQVQYMWDTVVWY